MLCFGGTVVFGRSPFQGDDDLIRQVSYDELRHLLSTIALGPEGTNDEHLDRARLLSYPLRRR